PQLYTPSLHDALPIMLMIFTPINSHHRIGPVRRHLVDVILVIVFAKQVCLLEVFVTLAIFPHDGQNKAVVDEVEEFISSVFLIPTLQRLQGTVEVASLEFTIEVGLSVVIGRACAG